jgi:carbon monoxide dehydrogenase subunit G
MIQKETLNLCIPRMDTNTTKEEVFRILKEMKIGFIQKVTEVPHKNDPKQKRLLMRVSGTTCNTNFSNFKNQIEEHGSIKLVYDMPWYWKIVPSHPHI